MLSGHTVIHRKVLASRHLSCELSEVMTDILGAVNFLNTRPLTSVFSANREEMEAKHEAL